MQLPQTPAGSTSPSSWVPVNACTLPSAELPLRLTEFNDLFTSLHDLDRVDPIRLRLRLDGGNAVQQRAQELTAKESSCCSFFTFAVGRDEDGLVVVDVEVPTARAGVLDGLTRQAQAAGSARTAPGAGRAVG